MNSLVRTLTAAGIVCLLTFGLSLTRMTFLNDHFDRIARARQIAAYGEHPFADFRDPGHFLALYVSAWAQRVGGGGLLGEAIVVNTAIAVATAVMFWLAASASGSLLTGLLAVFVAWIVPPRYYDYEKMLFYMTGLALCWRYVDSPTVARLALCGVVTGLAALFRYDNGLFILMATSAAIVVQQWRAPVRVIAHGMAYLAAVLLALAPALAFIHATTGLSEAARQIFQYAGGEGGRLELPRLALDGTSALYVFVVSIAPLALGSVLLRRGHESGVPPRSARPKIAAAAVLLACVSVFVLRNPIGPRLGAAMPVALVLAAWLAGQVSASRQSDAVRAMRAGVPALAMWVLVAVGVGVLALAIQQRGRLLSAPAALTRRASAIGTELRTPAPGGLFFPTDAGVAGLIRYLRACTPSEARVLVTWFGPEVFYFSQRGAAGGMVGFSGDHWSSGRDQRLTIDQMSAQSVPIAVTQEAPGGFRKTFPMIAAYLDAQYRAAGSSTFGNPRADGRRYDVLIRRDLGDLPVEPEWGLPCPAARR